MGGTRASVGMMVAEELGIDLDKVRPMVGDTSSLGYNFLTGGSRTTFASGKVAVDAARDLINQLRERAAKIWDVLGRRNLVAQRWGHSEKWSRGTD